MFRRNVGTSLLEKIFINPRIHTPGRGYKMTREKYQQKNANNSIPQKGLKASLLRKLPNPRAGDPYDAGLFGNKEKWIECH